MIQKMLAIAAYPRCSSIDINIFYNTHGAYAGDGDETQTHLIRIKQKNVGSGDSVYINCAQKMIKAGVGNNVEMTERSL